MVQIGSIIVLTTLLGPAWSAQMAQVPTTGELVDAATHTVHGTVTSVVGSRAADGRIISEVVLSIQRSVPALDMQSVAFEITGGTVDGVRMTVAGQPIPDEGQELVVLLRNGRVVGAGQGMFVPSGTEWAPIDGWVAMVDGVPSLTALLGDRSTSDSCAALVAAVGRDEGWTPRSTVATTLRRDSMRAIALGLLEGVSYRVTVCDGGEVDRIEAELFDPYDGWVERDNRDERARWTFTAEHTGQHLIGIQGMGFSEENHRTSVTVVLEYR